MAELLQVEKLCKFFGGVKAVNNVSFSVRKGQIKAIIGPNGAGKTTLFNVIAGNLRASGGKVIFSGEDITHLPDYQIVKLGIARTFQNTRVFNNMTVLENVMLGQHTRSRAGFLSTALRLPAMRSEERRIREAAMASLEFVGLQDYWDAPADTLPFKQQRMLELARAYSLNPRLMLIDEPAAGLNARETKEIAILIQRINAAGVTVLLVEHDMSLVMNISDEVLVLDCGEKIAEGPPAEIKRNQDVIAIYLGRRATDAANSEHPSRLQ